MLYFEIAAETVLLFAFFFGAVKLWRKGKPLYFQIIIAAIGCYALYQLFMIVVTFCDFTETYFNDGYFGLLGCYWLLFCANRGAVEKLFDKPKTKYTVISILAGVWMLALSTVIGIFNFDGPKVTFFLFILQQIPACFVVYFNIKHLFTPVDELGLIKGLRLTDIFSMTFCITCLLDIAAWINPSVISGIADIVLAFVAMMLAFSAVKRAEKWSF